MEIKNHLEKLKTWIHDLPENENWQVTFKTTGYNEGVLQLLINGEIWWESPYYWWDYKDNQIHCINYEKLPDEEGYWDEEAQLDFRANLARLSFMSQSLWLLPRIAEELESLLRASDIYRSIFEGVDDETTLAISKILDEFEKNYL